MLQNFHVLFVTCLPSLTLFYWRIPCTFSNWYLAPLVTSKVVVKNFVVLRATEMCILATAHESKNADVRKTEFFLSVICLFLYVHLHPSRVRWYLHTFHVHSGPRTPCPTYCIAAVVFPYFAVGGAQYPAGSSARAGN